MIHVGDTANYVLTDTDYFTRADLELAIEVAAEMVDEAETDLDRYGWQHEHALREQLLAGIDRAMGDCDWEAYNSSVWTTCCAEAAYERYGEAVLQRAWDDSVWAEECAAGVVVLRHGCVQLYVRER